MEQKPISHGTRFICFLLYCLWLLVKLAIVNAGSINSPGNTTLSRAILLNASAGDTIFNDYLEVDSSGEEQSHHVLNLTTQGFVREVTNAPENLNPKFISKPPHSKETHGIYVDSYQYEAVSISPKMQSTSDDVNADVTTSETSTLKTTKSTVHNMVESPTKLSKDRGQRLDDLEAKMEKISLFFDRFTWQLFELTQRITEAQHSVGSKEQVPSGSLSRGDLLRDLHPELQDHQILSNSKPGRPEITQEPMVFMSGSTGYLNCQAMAGHPPAVLKWEVRRRGEQNSTDLDPSMFTNSLERRGHMFTVLSRLTLLKLNDRDHEAHFSCVVENSVNSSVSTVVIDIVTKSELAGYAVGAIFLLIMPSIVFTVYRGAKLIYRLRLQDET